MRPKNSIFLFYYLDAGGFLRKPAAADTTYLINEMHQ